MEPHVVEWNDDGIPERTSYGQAILFSRKDVDSIAFIDVKKKKVVRGK